VRSLRLATYVGDCNLIVCGVFCVLCAAALSPPGFVGESGGTAFVTRDKVQLCEANHSEAMSTSATVFNGRACTSLVC